MFKIYIANYNRDMIIILTEKLYQEILDYNYYDLKLFKKINT